MPVDSAATMETLTLIVVLIAGVGLAAERFFAYRNSKSNPGEGYEKLAAAMTTRFDRLEDKLERCVDRIEDSDGKVVAAVDALRIEIARGHDG